MQKFHNPFYKEEQSYKRDLNPLKNYVDQASTYLSVSKGISKQEATHWLMKQIKEKRFANMKNPLVTHTHRYDNGDKAVTQTPLMTYIKEIRDEKHIVSPTLTTYVPTSVKKSLLAYDIENNVSLRNIAKKAMFAAEAKGDKTEQFFQNVTQKGTKLSNNSISGMHGVANNPLYNPSAHPTLTSNCRMTSGFGNANNEKLLGGNRHYFKPALIINNIVSTISNIDDELVKAVIDKYQLYLPTTDDVMECITYSSKLYGILNGSWYNKVKAFVNKLQPYQKAAFLYVGDLYHLRKHNDAFVRKFIRQLTTKVQGVKVDKPIEVLKSLTEDHVLFAHQVCNQEMAGRGKDYKAIEDENIVHTVAATSIHISKTIEDYADYITAFLMTTNVPAAVPYFPDSIRRVSLLSDTDSTFATAQGWQMWYHGELLFTPEATAVGACMIFLASQSIIHVLAIMSKNAGVDDKNLRKIAMKNEFYYPVLVTTKVAKHYFGEISCQEGNVYTEEKYKLDIKGVHLKNSNSPKYITDHAESLMRNIVKDIRDHKKISLKKYLQAVAGIENTVSQGIKDASTDFFRLGQIKDSSSYTRSESESDYSHYLMWRDCFAPKYGDYGVPPYLVIQIKTMIDSPSLTKQWLDKMQDKSLSNRIRQWMQTHNKKYIGTFKVPINAVYKEGMPKEIYDAIDVRSMMMNLNGIYYLILESLGFYYLNKKGVNLVSDHYKA